MVFHTKALAEDREKFWIAREGTFTNGYNMTIGGTGGNLISKYSDVELLEFGNKISQSLLSMSQEKKELWVNKVKDSWICRSPEEKETINQKRSNTCLKTFAENKDRFMKKRNAAYASKTENELIEIKNKISVGMKSYHSTKSDDDKREFGENIRKRMIRRCKTPSKIYDSIDDAAQAEGIPKSTIYRWMKNQKEGYSLL